MLLKRNLLETLLLITTSGSLLCLILNYVTNISPLTGVWLPVYVFTVFVISFLFSFKFLQWLLHLNKPIKYDLDSVITNYPYLGFIHNVLPKFCFIKKSIKVVLDDSKEYDTNELSVISTVLERKLVSSWYFPYISQEIGFPFACKQMLDQMIGKAFQICTRIDTKDVYVDLSSILISHLKEYRKALKRQEISASGTIESQYKKYHLVSEANKNCNSAEHCTNILRVVLKELVPWELWDTPHSELLVRILSHRLNDFIETTLIDPDMLNTRLMAVLLDQSQVDNYKPDIKENIEKIVGTDITDTKAVDDKHQAEIAKGVQTTTIESALSTLITKSTAPILQRAITDEINNEVLQPTEDDKVGETKGSVPLDITSSPILRQRRGRQGKSEVKIYDRIIEGSVKTWETDMDLQCISLGQDLLASLDGEITLSRLWEQDADTDGISPQPPSNTSSLPQPLWFGEEDTLDMELNTELASPQKKEPSPTKKEHSPKPTEVLLKDLQTTVNQAKTKIGDLQVAPEYYRNLGVSSCNQSATGDEAAGMMEGLLDFGIAGFKKGLRFTGLHDDKHENLLLSHREHNLPPPPPTSPRHANKQDDKDYSPSTVIQRDDNGPSIVPPLMKQHRVSSQDSVLSQSRGRVEGSVPMLIPLSDSPEPEYEDPADLSTSIAKLRSLLQQRTAESPPSVGEVWWSGAEETRGRTQRGGLNADTATLADEYDISIDRSSPQSQATNNMQRLDKLFQRTVTGVFNSLRTAVGAEGEESPGAPPHAPPQHWTYVCTPIETSVGGAVARLVGSRRAHSHVDAALDSLEQLAPPTQHQQENVDDFEEWWCGAGARWCGTADALCASRLWQSHVTHRLATLLLADLAETVICNWLDEATVWLKDQIFVCFEELAKESDGKCNGKNEKAPLRKFDVDETCAAVMAKLPGPLYLFGEETLTGSVKLVVSSFSHKEINKDLVFRVLDLLVVHFKRSAGVRNSFDIN